MAQSQPEIFNLKGIQIPEDAFIVIVKTAWNELNVSRLLQGCENILKECKVQYKVIEVPGAVEIPFAIKYYSKHTKRPVDAFIAIGCIIKGGTPHFEYVCQSVTNGITDLNLQLDSPVIYGILTLLNQEQAEERLGGIHGHKGEEAAATAIKMIHLKNQIKALS